MVKKTEAWQTNDGRIFDTEVQAVRYESHQQGMKDGIWACITELEDWAKMGAGGNLTPSEVEATEMFKSAQMLREHFSKLKVI